MNRKTVGLWTIALCPLVLVLSAISYGFAREYQAWAELKQTSSTLIQEYSGANPLLSSPAVLSSSRNANVEQEERQFQRKMAEFDLMSDVIYGQVRDFDLIGPSHLPIVLNAPDTTWEEAPLFAEMVQDVELLMDNAEELLAEQDGFSNATFETRASLNDRFSSLLLVYFRYAFYHRDSENAARALKLLSRITFHGHGYGDAYSMGPSQMGPSQLGLSFGDIARLYALLAGTLSYDVWSDEQLSELSDDLLRTLEIEAKLDAAYRYRPALTAQRVVASILPYGMPADSKNLQHNMMVDSVYLNRLLEASKQEGGIRTTRDLEKSFRILLKMDEPQAGVDPTGVLAVNLPAGSKYSQARQTLFENAEFAYELGALEDLRRATKLAVAIKRFVRAQDRWPNSLKELSSHNPELKTETVQGQSFRYSAFDGPPSPAVTDVAIIDGSMSEFLTPRLTYGRYYPPQWLRDYKFSPLRIVVTKRRELVAPSPR
ncbi:hypothetical protein Q31b_36570 [Novipirellula aureliae]|uniref:Uncharacterized protein n=1 Tax=Novipirellula aureliae TaxID=2527966 RepID=A0A5C6DZI4_9BACT|nr:hypothetical protein [Novipirellula aureliae]TWU40309.1 hypothetical protein Q31b_36570 [Novipirellula aureliae]